MSKTLILKVLSGSQLGVEVGLPDGEYSFGSGSDAEIQFADLSMAPVHGQLRVAGGKVEIRDRPGGGTVAELRCRPPRGW